MRRILAIVLFKNRSNPDPAKEVRLGDQSWDEMAIGYFEVGFNPKLDLPNLFLWTLKLLEIEVTAPDTPEDMVGGRHDCHASGLQRLSHGVRREDAIQMDHDLGRWAVHHAVERRIGECPD
jgi:hypothetical protein